MNKLAQAIAIASTEHINQVDKAGKPYILHLLWVMNKVRHLGEDYMIVAVLHDFLEDTNYKSDYLISSGFKAEIVEAICLLTKEEFQDYKDYIEDISKNSLAREVKLRDLEHNSKITRLKDLENKDLKRIKKYHTAYNYLKNYSHK